MDSIAFHLFFIQLEQYLAKPQSSLCALGTDIASDLGSSERGGGGEQ